MKKENVVNKKFTKGFTLLELLVVVLIIGILAAIALPQYQLAVGRAKFATLKEFTRSLGEARNRYFLTHSKYPTSIKDLDIDIDVKSETYTPNTIIVFTTSQNIRCNIWLFDSFEAAAACGKDIFGKRIIFYVKQDGTSPHECLVYSEDKKDKANQLCAKETNKKSAHACTDDGAGLYCEYRY